MRYSIKSFLVVLLTVSCYQGWSQCGSSTAPATPTNSWVGSVYDGVNNFTNYQGYITETQNFDENAWPDTGTFPVATGCNVTLDTYTIRYTMKMTLGCGYHTFTVGGDDGVRLSADNGSGSISIISGYVDQGYTVYTNTVFLVAGTYTLTFDYYENGGASRVSFNYAAGAAVTTSSGGTVAADQSSCTTAFDPAAFTSTSPAGYCSGAAVTGYQWEISTTSSSTGFSNIASATALTYDAPSPVNVTTWYRRRATDGSTLVYSNVITVTIDPPPASQTLAGANTWVGHVYDGADNYTSNYQGQITETQTFDEGFCGDNCTTAINGCDFNTETFSVRFRMDYTFAGGARDFSFTVGGDDGYRFSTDGGTTWLINNYGAHSYATTTNTQTLTAGTYNFIIEYYENTGQNRVTFTFSSALPVTWSYFDGYFINKENVIEWRTVTELNNAGFVVERSTNGKTFDSLAFVDGHGTANMTNEYEFHDSRPFPGWNYYRLKQIDHDRKYEYSRLIPVYSDITTATAIYPNPATDDLYVSHVRPEQHIGVSIRGVMNGQFYTLANDPKQPSKFSLKNVAPGMYLVTITVDDEVNSEKLVVY